MPIIISGRVQRGAGLATRLHNELRGRELEAAVRVPLYPGTLNVKLDSRFPWEETDAIIAQLSDPVNYQRWHHGHLTQVQSTRARLYPVVVEDMYRAWVLRLDRSNASLSLVELISQICLRDVLPSSRLVLKLGGWVPREMKL